MFNVQCKLTRWTPHADGSTECDRVLTVYASSITSLPYLGLLSADCLPSCSLWRRCCSLATDTICLSHSVDSSVLSYTVRSPLSRSIAWNILKALARVRIWNVRVHLPSFPFVQFRLMKCGWYLGSSTCCSQKRNIYILHPKWKEKIKA